MNSSHDAGKLRALLKTRNQFSKRELETLLNTLQNSPISPRLKPFADRLVVAGVALSARAEGNLKKLEVKNDAILGDVLSDTGGLIQRTRLIHQRVAAPVLRYSPDDEIALKVIVWMHRQHVRTSTIPAACTAGETSIWPLLDIAPIYFVPCMEGRGLLYLSLLFHEFGHLLYALSVYRQEMDDLVQELQQKIEASLHQLSGRNDHHSNAQAELVRAIVETWYSWTQEFFCDAVGLHLGGAAYLNAFSSYTHFLQSSDYVVGPDDLRSSTHPRSWLRIRLLTERARRLGFEGAANAIELDWQIAGEQLRVDEDYHGYFNDALQDELQNTLDDMLTTAELEPDALAFGLSFADCQKEWTPDQSPVVLLNNAWKKARTSTASEFATWEEAAIPRLVSSPD